MRSPSERAVATDAKNTPRTGAREVERGHGE